MKQLTDNIMMIRPVSFGYNPETAENNAFQSDENAHEVERIRQEAKDEFDRMVDKLESHGIRVFVFEDTAEPIKTDAVFPNNWVSFHENGSVITYPMFSKIRRLERREDLLEQLGKKFEMDKRYSFEFYESVQKYLEGTGSLVLDRVNRIAYACLSQRTNIEILEKFAILNNYKTCVFHARDKQGDLIYHTNVMMALGLDFVIICMDAIHDPEEKEKVLRSFINTDKELIEITMDQMYSFAGNMLQVLTIDGTPLLLMSESAFRSLQPEQIKAIQKHCDFEYFNIETIEKYGGGSVRCMMAEIFLPLKNE